MVVRYPKLIKPSEGLKPKNFSQGKGRTVTALYAVVLKEHPRLVKVGRTTNWASRRKDYANWNLRADCQAIFEERVFMMAEEFVDLVRLERAVLVEMGAPVFGSEWFETDLESACRAIDRVITWAGLSYDLFVGAK